MVCLGLEPWGGRMEGTEKSTELWRHPKKVNYEKNIYNLAGSRNVSFKDTLISFKCRILSLEVSKQNRLEIINDQAKNDQPYRIRQGHSSGKMVEQRTLTYCLPLIAWDHSTTENTHLLQKGTYHCTENTHLLQKGTYHCTADPMFDWLCSIRPNL